MPHMTIEYTKGLEKKVQPNALVKAVFDGACASALFNNDLVKTRAIGYDHYQYGLTSNDFLHVTAKILSGRTVEQKSTLSRAILSQLQSLLGKIEPLTVTVEVVDIEKESHSAFLI